MDSDQFPDFPFQPIPLNSTMPMFRDNQPDSGGMQMGSEGTELQVLHSNPLPIFQHGKDLRALRQARCPGELRVLKRQRISWAVLP